MLSIGDFARLAGVSVRMLRHYAALGLLRPARVDPDSGYRSYTTAQLDRVNRLVALKDLGFSLEDCGRLLGDDVPVSQLRGMLRTAPGGARRADRGGPRAARAGRAAS